MPYRRNDYSFVVDSTFRPFSFQEMVQPLALYKDAYDKNEEAYQDLIDKTNTFAYLEQVAKDNPNSVAAQIYKGYADEMNRQFDDFSRNGLSMGNRRALVNLKRRYNGEIGRLDRARTSMEEERKRRQVMNAKDSSMLYATDNLDIDQFLDENTPNLYAVSGNDLQVLGANLGKAISSREYKAGDAGPVLRDYYRDWVEKVGISQDSIAAFMQSPEVLQEVDNILKAQGASGNLSGNNLDRARQNVMNGIYSGIVYQESHKPVRDEDKMSAAQRASNALGWANHNESVRQHNLQLKMAGYDENGVYHPEYDQTLKKATAIAAAKNAGKTGGSGSGSSSGYGAINQKGIRISWKDDPANSNYTSKNIDDDEEYKGIAYEYDDLPDYAKAEVDKVIGNKGNNDNYIYFFTPWERGRWNDTETSLDIVPRKVMRDENDDDSDDFTAY